MWIICIECTEAKLMQFFIFFSYSNLKISQGMTITCELILGILMNEAMMTAGFSLFTLDPLLALKNFNPTVHFSIIEDRPFIDQMEVKLMKKQLTD